METIVCKCRVITPMFSSGADQTGCEIRVPEIKAAMRFWWRAAHSNLKLEELKEREALIFGGSGDEEARKSSFTMRVENARINYFGQKKWDDSAIKFDTGKVNKIGKPIKINIFDYLAYGIVQSVEVGKNPQTGKAIKKTLLQRDGIAPDSIFDLVICVDKECKRVNKKNQIEVVPDLNPVEEVEKALELFSCFGSLGSRSRNGFGKVVIEKKDGKEFKTDMLETCGEYVGINSKFPEYTSFGLKSSLFGTGVCPSWQKALAEIGNAYRLARIGETYKSGLVVNNQGDHHTGLNRQYLAQPLHMGKDKDGKDIIVNTIGIERMAKQFFMIVEKNGKEEYCGYILHLPFDIEKVSKQCDKQIWLDANNAMKQELRKYLEEIAYE